MNVEKVKISRFSFVLILFLSFTLLHSATRIMPLGDSITWDFYFGEDRTDAERSGYRNYLWYKLANIEYEADFVGSRSTGEAIEPYFDGDNEGHTGWTSYEIAENVYHFLEMNPADIILLHIGTNDFDSSPAGVEHILDEIDRFEGDNNLHITVILARVIMLPSNASQITQFNNNVEAMAQTRIENGDDIQVVDMENSAGLDYQKDLIDGVHPNDCGYEKMANIWFSALTNQQSPGITYADCGGNGEENEDSGEDNGDNETPEDQISDEEIERLYAFPSTLVDPGNIISIDVNEENRSVVFTTYIPDSGITF